MKTFILIILLPNLFQTNYVSIRYVSAQLDLPPLQSTLNDLNKQQTSNEAPDACESCKLLVESFTKGMERTMRGKHEGGDTSWEEKNLKSYVDSEIRLVEIQETLCDDATKCKAQCLYINEEAEAYIEEWWFKHRKNNVHLHDYLCINKLKKCCPEDSFGPTCQKCPSQCNGHGQCDGSGTRIGSGECICTTGYVGNECESCDENYYQISTKQNNDEPQFSCLSCHQACKDGCTGPRSTNCTNCKSGYKREPVSNSCIDINECELGPNEIELDARKLCPDGTYCVNTDGHYKCADCHRACSTCVGFGRNKCLTCTTDYYLDDEHNCVFIQDRQEQVRMSAGETYLGYTLRYITGDFYYKFRISGLYGTIVYFTIYRFHGQVWAQRSLYFSFVYLVMILMPMILELSKRFLDVDDLSMISEAS